MDARQQKQITERRKLLIVHTEVISKCPWVDHWLEFNYLLMHALYAQCKHICLDAMLQTLAKEFDAFCQNTTSKISMILRLNIEKLKE